MKLCKMLKIAAACIEVFPYFYFQQHERGRQLLRRRMREINHINNIDKQTTQAYSTLTDEQRNTNTECPISQETYEDNTAITITTCKHIFSYEALKVWLNRNNTCPICRTEL